MYATAHQRPASQTRGFSLVELMVVLSVLGILAGISVRHATSAMSAAKITVCEKNRILYEEQAQLFEHRNGRPPTRLEELIEARQVTKISCPAGGVLSWQVTDPEAGHSHKALVCSVHGPRTRIGGWNTSPPQDGGTSHLLLDGFNDRVATGWTQVRGRYWEIVDGAYRAGIPGRRGGEHRSFSGDPSWKDYTVSATVTLQSGQGYGLYFRATDPKKANAYIFQYDPGKRGGSFLFRKIKNGREQRPFAIVKAPKGYDWYGTRRNVKVVVEGDTFTAYIDGKKVVQGSDSTWKQGGIGLRTWGRSVADFDDVQVDAGGR